MENLNKTSNNLQGTFPASEASLIDIIGTKVETDENGAITKGGWEKLNNTLEMYSDKRYETARYLFVKDGKIVRHVAVSSKTPASTAVKPDDDFLLKLRTYAEETDSKVIFIHNHPSGYVMPSENDVNLTKYLESVFIDNGGKARFLGHAILDHGNYGLYTKKSGWAAMTDGEIRPLSDLDKNYSSDEKNYGLRIKGKEELVALAEKAKSLDSLEIWNKQDWIPAFFASASKIVKSHDYIGKNEFSNTRSLAEKLKSIGRNHNSENVYFFPSTREQQLQCEAFAQTTGLVANIVFRNEDGNFELSDYSGGTLFSDTRAKDISVEDTNSLDRSEIERKLFEATDNNTNETLSTQAKKDGNMKNTNTQTIESNEVVGVGFAPTIQTLRMGASSTRLRASPTTENIIAQDENPVNKKNHIAANFVLEKLKAANIEVIADKSEMLSILESGRLVQKMAAFHGTSGAEKSFDGYGTYVVSVNEGDAKQIGMRVASKKYGDAFYVKGQAFETFLKEHKFSPYWAELLKQSRLDNVEELQTTMMLSDTKGNAELERQKNELSTLFKYGLVEHKREKAFVYSIDIPDDDGRNYLPYENPIGLENAEKINGALEKLGTQWRVTRNDGGRQVYFNTLSEKVFNGSQEEASKFLKDAGFVGMRMNEKNYIILDEKDINVNKRVQFMTDKNGEIYGFAHGGKVYLDPDLMNANTPAHEYTHLWDAYTRQTNPELWERGKAIFAGTRLWEEVVDDPNYADIADDEDLVLSEVHARICGDIAQRVLERMAEQDGEIARDRAIDWDKEVTEYIASELGAEIAMPELGSESYVSDSIRHEVARNFLAQPMKDLMAGKGITLEREQEKSELYKENEAELKFIVEEMLEESLPGPQKMAKPAENKKDPAQTQQGLSDVQDTATAISTHIRHQNNIVEIKSQEHFANKFGELANEIGNSASPMQPGEFLDRIKQTFGMDVATETTGYVFSREYGTSFKLRVANHKAVLKNRTGDKTEITSVVIQLCDNKGQDNNKAKLSEFVYFPESLDKETQLGIVSGIKDWISSHEYTDRNYDQMYVSTARALRERLKESERAVQKMAMSKERKETETALSEEDLEYIRSPEFIEKFGDWEKAQRLEKLKAAEAIIADGKIIVEGEEISENLDYLREDKNKKLLQILARNLGRQVVGIYHNDDLNIDVKVSMNNIDEIKHHNILFENHIEAIKNIPEIIQRAIYIGNESNSDKTRHPNITEYKYFATGLKIDGVDYTCKSVIGVDRNGNNYYDQSLSTIEKGRFVDIVMQKNKLGNLSPLISPWESEFEEDSNPSAHYDKRLINICQVPQMKYLDKNLMPTKEAVEAVRAGKLHIEKDRQVETMFDATRDAETERIQKMAKPAKNANDIAPSARGLSEEQETAERRRRAAVTDYDDPIEAKEAWHNGTEEEREAISRSHAGRPRNAPSGDDFVRVTIESADAGLFADMRDEMGNDPLAGNTPETLSVLRNIGRLASEAGNGAETEMLAREFVASLEERGVYLYKCGQKNLLRILDTRNLAAESGGIPETVPIEEAGSFFWNHHNVRTDGVKSSYDLIAEAHGTAYRRFHAKEAMRKILAENGNDHELTEEETARLSGAGFRSMESLGDIGRLAAEIGKEELFRKISGAALRWEEAIEKLQAGEKVERIEERKSEKRKEPQQESPAQAAEQAVPEESAQKEVSADPQQDENSLPSQMKEMRKMMEEQNRAIRMLQEKLIQAQKENSELHQTISMLQAQGPIMDDKSQAHESGREEGRGERPNSETQHLKNIDGFSSETAFNVNQKIPKFGKFSEETKKIEINDGCVFQKYIEHPTDKSMDKILYLDPKHTRINENGEEVHTFEMSAREYQKIINASEKYEARKLDMKNDYDWLYANEEYQTALKIDHDKFRRNTAANFFHNVRVSFRASGCQNVDDAMKCARNIVAKMTPYERKRFNEQRNEYGAEKFDQMLIKHFTNNRLELTEEELARLEVERKENKDSLLEQIKDKEKEPRYLQDGETIGETKTTVGSDLKIALHMTGFDGKRIKTPIDDFKIVKVTENFRPDKAILYSKKMKSSYTIPLATLEGYIKEMEQIQGKMEKVKAKSEKVEKKLLKRKEKRLTLDTGRVGR